MTQIAKIVNNEQDYLNLIADAIESGIHRPNMYAKGDEDDMSISDSFEPFPVSELYEYLGVYPSNIPLPGTTTEVVGDDGQIWEETDNHIWEWEPDYRQHLKVCGNENVLVPTEKDYPIMVYWNWEDDFDRFGKITMRNFQWWSLKDIAYTSGELKNTRDKWESKFRSTINSYAEMQRNASKT